MLRHLIPRRGRLPELHSTGRPVVLLHGTLSSPGNFADLAAALDARGRRVIVPEYGRRGTTSLMECVDEVRSTLIDAHSQLDIIGHSLGGLVGLLAADCPELRGRIGQIIGLGACWRGVPPQPRWSQAIIARLLGRSFVDIMQPFSPVVPAGVEVVSIISTRDTTVPEYSSRLGRVVELPAVHHARLPDQVEAVCKVLR
ncbi:triacylglycerol lipase [Corynebacterium sp. 11A]|uniref:esterase/lipase family protein n=1 Tax=Corynebacterium sp. 11A TaxID=2080510 RepID=UPI00124D99C3|nr:alpha/beta fold hydrolase [Corynebacterium sp. 11A]